MPRDSTLRPIIVTPTALVRSAVVDIESQLMKAPFAEVLAERYGSLGEETRILAMLARAAQSPANTLTPGYAAELVVQSYAAWLDLLKDEAVFAQIGWTPASFTPGTGKVVFPSRDDSPAYPANLEAMWRKEGDPIRVGRITTRAVELVPYTPGVISHFTRELFKLSTPSIEAIVRAAIVEDSAEAFDLSIFGNAPAVVDLRPAGLTNGIAAGDTRASGGNTFALIDADLLAMIKAMATNKRGRRLYWAMSEANRLALASKLNTTSDVAPYRAGLIAARPTLLEIPVARSLAFPSDRVLLVDAEAVAMAGGAPEFDVSEEATIHEESAAPLPISTPGAPATVAAPTRSLFQTNSAAVRAVYTISWAALRSHPIQELTGVDW